MNLKALVRALAGMLAIALCACEPFPRDPRDTTAMIEESARLRVGVIHNPPWTDTRTQSPQGREIELVTAFAQHLGAEPEWHYLDNHEGFLALEEGDIDLLIGGLAKPSPFAGKAAFTRPYDKSRSRHGKDVRQHVLAVRRGENRFLLELEQYLKRVFPQHPESLP